MRTRLLTRTRLAGIGGAILLALSALASAQAPAPPKAESGARYTATAIDMNAPAGLVAQSVDIVINRWSTDAERDKVVNTILESGQDKLLSVLQSLPPVGSIHAPGSIGWNLRYARHGADKDGRDRIMILADRPVSFMEMRDRPRTVDYPFTVIELRIGSNDRGEGRLHFGAKVTNDRQTGTLIIENFNIQPIALNDVRREKK